LHHVITAPRVNEVGEHPHEEVTRKKSGRLDIDISFRKTLVVVCEYPVSAVRTQPIRTADSAPIAV